MLLSFVITKMVLDKVSVKTEIKLPSFSSAVKKLICLHPDSPSSAHPFYVLDNFIDIGLIDLNLLPGNKESDGFSLSYVF